MTTLTEQAPDYPEKVAAYLAKTHTRRLPWSALVAGGHLTFTSTSAERAHRSDLGEAAIRLLGELGFSVEELEKYEQELPPPCTPSKPTASTPAPSPAPPASP